MCDVFFVNLPMRRTQEIYLNSVKEEYSFLSNSDQRNFTLVESDAEKYSSVR